MGWLLKVAALLAGLVALTVGFWPLWLTCFGYLGYSLWSATKRRTVVLRDERKYSGAPMARAAFKKRYVAAAFFFVLTLVAFGADGALAPWAFLSLGTVIVLSGLFNRGPGISEVRAVPDSILLRSRWLPISWVSIAELKFGTTQLSRPLSSVGSELIVTLSSGKASVYLPIRVWSLSAPGAERKVAARLAPLARTMSGRGAYVLPLDSEDAASRMSWSLKPVGMSLTSGRDGTRSLSSSPFDVLVLAPAGHMLESAAAYLAGPGKKAGAARIPSVGRKLESRPLMWEVVEALGEKHVPQTPDAYTNFLSSVCATRGEGLGDRLVNAGETGTGALHVGSLGASQVELSRPQLRAIVSAYG